MSYLTLPRLHFSGQFQANPSTINNVRLNYNPEVYPDIQDMEQVALLWNPMGNGGFDFKGCVVTRVDYADGSSATTPQEDPVIGQPVSAVKHAGFPLPATIVDLDVQQQGVSELWALVVEIGSDTMGVRGDFAPAAFNSMWGQAIGKDAPGGSASFSAVYQSTLRDVVSLGDLGPSKFLSELQSDSENTLSIQFVVNSHNNSPEVFRFDGDTLWAAAKNGVPVDVLKKVEPLTKIGMGGPANKGNLPTLDFTLFALKQYLSTKEFNANIDAIVAATRQPYEPATSNEFTFGSVCGVVGNSSATSPGFFVPSRMMNVQEGVQAAWFAPFDVTGDGRNVTVNLGNSLATVYPGADFDQNRLGTLWLVAFHDGRIDDGKFDPANATKLVEIDYTDHRFMAEKSGFVTFTSDVDLGTTPLGILSERTSSNRTTQTLLLAEDPDGWYLRADQFVFRMNPGVATTAENPRGETATLNVHALKFGQPAPDGTKIQLTDDNPSGLGEPAAALTVTPTQESPTSGGIATFTLKASDPGNPRGFLNGQLYFKAYNLLDSENPTGYQPVPGDIVSIQIYDQEADGDALSILAEYGRMYLIMSFLADQQAIEGIDLRNMIKLLLEKPMADAVHMPVTRDMSFANLQQIVAWINSLNDS